MNSMVEAPVFWSRPRKASIFLAVIGFVDSLYLSWVKLSGSTAACSGIGDCEAVNNSRYADIGGIPIALIGAFSYVLIIGLLLIGRRFPKMEESFGLMVFGLTLVGTLYSAYLTYIEIAVLKAICPFCVVSAVVMLILFILAVFRLRESFI